MTETGTQAARLLGGRYQIDEYLGQGGMSTVYLGTDTKLGRQVAIKVMRAHLAGDEQFRYRFRQEAQSASRLTHPGIVRVFDAGEDLIQTGEGPQQLPFIVMEYVDGENLRELTDRGRLTSTEVCRVVEAVLVALEYSHRAGIVHRDIKPANIMITRNGQVKVMDFGIARAVSETSSTVQQTTAILGTAAYFSPEQAKGEMVDARTDLYSTGVLLYELLSGDVPFRGDTAVAVAYQHVSERPEPPSEREPSITPELERVILHALAKDRARRFQSATEFRQALKLAADGTMPELADDGGQNDMLFSGGEEVSASDLALRRLSGPTSANRSQTRPPVMWIWAAILTVITVIAAVVIWVIALAPQGFTVAGSPEMPDIVGAQEMIALERLADIGVEPVVTPEPHETVEAGLVTRTTPEAGARITADTTVTVYVSTGPAPVAVPKYNLTSVEEYSTILEEAGLVVGTVSAQPSATEAEGRVLGVSPDVGTELERGSAVELIVSNGRVEVPDVTGQTIAAASELLDRSLRLAVRIIPDPGCPAVDTSIQRQSIIGEVPQGSEIEIIYCSGEINPGRDSSDD